MTDGDDQPPDTGRPRVRAIAPTSLALIVVAIVATGALAAVIAALVLRMSSGAKARL